MAMSTLEARLHQLRDASTSLNQTAETVRNAVLRANADVDALLARGFESPAATVFFETFRRQRSIMDEWPTELEQFSHGLDSAADAIEEAAHADQNTTGGEESGGSDDGSASTGGTPPPPPVVPPASSSSTGTGTGTSGTGTGTSGTGTGTSSSGSHGRGRGDTPSDAGSSSGSTASAPEAPPPEAPPLDAYTNAHNQQLLTEMDGKQQELTQTQSQITQLQDRRAALQTELDNLTAALTTPSGVVPNARMRGLQEQINALDGQISSLQQHANDLQSGIQDLQTRLERVSPAAGADLQLISGLEGGHTIDAILNATRQADNSVNCVNWVCNRMPIPPGIPNTAYLWPENARRHPEYGIRMGDVPLAGSVLVMQPDHPFADDRFGHVMYVERVDSSGGVWITDNFHHEPVLLSTLTNVTTGPDITYMYFPWQTQG
jgi:prefoldin subunit 5